MATGLGFAVDELVLVKHTRFEDKPEDEHERIERLQAMAE